ncbi:MAG: DUF177 domain-containing protein [Deltaproteobacteria bacterium]|nr:DUF177 domain-containing protein [Deltaproteobacteria bacterium]
MTAPLFKVLLRELPTHRHIEVDGAFVASSLVGMPMREALEAPPDDANAGKGVVDLDLYADETTVFANGSIKGELRVACGRCVGPATIVIDEKLRVTYVPGTDDPAAIAAIEAEVEAGDSDGLELEEDDLELFHYDGETIDLEPLIREQFVLAVPYAPLCREDCKGLCAQCGADLNTAPCACESPIDPRFAALKGLKLTS